MTHRALVERNTRAELGTSGEELPAVWETHIAALPCFLYTPKGREPVQPTGVIVTESPMMLAPWGTDITESDRVNGVNDRLGKTYRAGIFRIASVIEAHSHLEVQLEAVA